MSAWKRWQDWTAVVLGVLLFLAPFAFSAAGTGAAAWTGFIGGILLVIVGLWDLYRPATMAGEWTEGVIGILVFIAPWVLAFSALTIMAWSAWVIGVLAVVLAASVVFATSGPAPTAAPQH